MGELWGGPGEVSKYANQGISVLAAVQPAGEVVEALAAKVAAKGAPFALAPVAADPAKVVLGPELIPEVDVVTAFGDALGGGWASRRAARTMLRNVAAMLPSGGLFVGTAPDSASMWYKAQKSATVAVANFVGPLYKVEFASNETMSIFAASASLRLSDGELRACPLIHFATLIELAAAEGLFVVDIQNAAAFFADHAADHPEIVKAFAVFANFSSLHRDAEDLLSLFTTFVFRKA